MRLNMTRNLRILSKGRKSAMKANSRAVVLMSCLVTFALMACSSQEPTATNEPVPTSEVAPVAQEPVGSVSSEPSPPSVAGQLQAIDPATGTMSVKDAAGKDWTFSFTDATEIVGAAGVQGLSSQKGNDVIVNYSDQDNRWMAIRVEMIPK
jgi:hypothetical protein